MRRRKLPDALFTDLEHAARRCSDFAPDLALLPPGARLWFHLCADLTVRVRGAVDVDVQIARLVRIILSVGQLVPSGTVQVLSPLTGEQ